MGWKKITSVTAGLSILGVSLVGCGSSPAGGSNSSAGLGKIPSGKTITLWVWEGNPVLSDVTKIADAWAKKHGDKVMVVNQSTNPNGFQFYATAARTGKGPDVLFGMPHDNNGLFAQESLISPVPKGVFNPSLYPASVDQALKVNGQYYSLPNFVQTLALYYNKNLVKTPPTTWAEFVKSANQHGFMFAQHNLYYDYGFIGGMGGYVFRYHNGRLNPNNIGLNNAGAVKGFALIRSMDSRYHWMTPSTTGAVGMSQFTHGTLGMYIDGPWDVPNFQKAKIPYGVAPLPQLPNGRNMTPFLGVITTIVNSRSPYQSADWSLAKALDTASAQKSYFTLSQQIPALTSLENSAAIRNNPSFKAFSQEVPHSVPMPNIPQMQAVWNAMSVIKDIVNGKVTPKTGANDFVSNVKKGITVQGS